MTERFFDTGRVTRQQVARARLDVAHDTVTAVDKQLRAAIAKRDKAIWEASTAGLSLSDIARRIGLKKTRVHEIVKRHERIAASRNSSRG